MTTQLLACNMQAALQTTVDALVDFPASTDKSTMRYNTGKLLVILREKELQHLINDDYVVEEAQRVSVEFGNLLSVINQDAEQGFRRYEELEKTALENFSDLVYLYVKQWAISIKALYYYRTNRLDLAQSIMLECIALNDLLIHEGLSTLISRSAELNRNYARVLVAKDNAEKGYRLSGDVLNYLLTGKPGQLHGSVFRNNSYWERNTYVREGYAYEYFRGMVHTLIRSTNTTIDQKTLFGYYFNDLDFEVFSPDRSLMHEWLKLKQLYYYGDKLVFLEQLTSFLKQETAKQYDLLKISLIQDLEQLLLATKVDMAEFSKPISFFLTTKVREYDYLKLFVRSYQAM